MPLKIAAKVDKVDEVYFRETIAPLLDQPGIEFIGEIDERAKSEFLGEAQALLFPIDWPEPFGLVMIEAMACGTPVLAFRKGSVSEIIEDGVTGRIVSSIDEAMLALPEVIALDRRTVRRRFEERFNATRMAKDYVTLYRSLLKQSALVDAPSLAPSVSPALPPLMSPPPEVSTLRKAGRYATDPAAGVRIAAEERLSTLRREARSIRLGACSSTATHSRFLTGSAISGRWRPAKTGCSIVTPAICRA